MAKRVVIPNISSLCTNYRNDLQFAVKNNNELRCAIRNRTGNYIERSIRLKLGCLFNQTNRWIDTLLKMDPVAYADAKSVYWLHIQKRHDGQVKFANKVLPMVEKLDFEDKDVMNELKARYGMFLDICMMNNDATIVPTLIEDFVWHSHMTNHKEYVRMTTELFGRILGHRTDIDMKKADMETKKIRDEYMKSKGLIVDNTTMAGIAAMTLVANGMIENPTEKKTDSSSSSSDCVGITDWNLNPLNPLNPLSPLSPLNQHHHSIISCSSSISSNHSSSSSGSSCGSSCGSSSCGD